VVLALAVSRVAPRSNHPRTDPDPRSSSHRWVCDCRVVSADAVVSEGDDEVQVAELVALV